MWFLASGSLPCGCKVRSAVPSTSSVLKAGRSGEGKGQSAKLAESYLLLGASQEPFPVILTYLSFVKSGSLATPNCRGAWEISVFKTLVTLRRKLEILS